LQKEVVAGFCHVSDDPTLIIPPAIWMALQGDVGRVIHTDDQRQAGLVEPADLVCAIYFDQTVQIGSSQRRVNTILLDAGLTLSVCRTSRKPLRLPVAV